LGIVFKSLFSLSPAETSSYKQEQVNRCHRRLITRRYSPEYTQHRVDSMEM
jgi:hypothetical protein